MTTRASREETVARKVFDLLADIRLSPYYIGYYLAHPPHPGIYDMLKGVVEAMERTEQERRQEIKEMIVGDETMKTTFENKCEILAKLWVDYSNDDSFEDFFQTNDISLPLSFAISKNLIAGVTQEAEGLIEDTFVALLEIYDVEDSGFDSLDEILEGFEPLPED